MHKVIGKGAITVDRDLIGRLRGGEMEKVVALIQAVGQTVLDEVNVDSRTVLLSYGNPAVVQVDLKKLSKLKYENIRQELLKLVDMQRRAHDDEVSRLERALGK